MSKEKQIEEMARTLLLKYHGMECFCNCTQCGKCTSYHYAETLYNAGYRKQNEGEWKISKIGDGDRVRTCSACHISQSVNVYKGKVMFMYCPYCGAKMTGVG